MLLDKVINFLNTGSSFYSPTYSSWDIFYQYNLNSNKIQQNNKLCEENAGSLILLCVYKFHYIIDVLQNILISVKSLTSSHSSKYLYVGVSCI